MMKTLFPTPVARAFGALALGATLLTAAFPAMSAPGPMPAGPEMHHRVFSEADRVAFAQKHLDRMAARLEIKASQQGAWKTYSQVVLDQARRMSPPPFDAKGDAASLMHQRAAHMEQMAKNMNQLADATAKLSGALTAEQRQVLDNMAREHRHGFGGRHGGPRGERPEARPAPAKP